MKILILSIYNDTPEYKEMLNIQRKYVHSHESVDFFFIMFRWNKSLETEIEKDVIYVHGVENYLGLTEKTVRAMDFLIKEQKRNYDFVVRTNISTLINYKELLTYFESIPKTNVYAGGVSILFSGPDFLGGLSFYKKKLYGLEDQVFFQGTSIIFSIDVVMFILENAKQIKFDIVDDVTFGLFVKTFLPQVYLQILKLKFPKQAVNKFSEDAVFLRNKTDNRIEDIKNMQQYVNNLYTITHS